MFKPMLTRLLNHLITQNSWARQQLQPFASKSVCFNIPPVNATLTILEDGGLAIAGESNTKDATVTIAASVALRLLAKDEAANTLIRIEGDTELATTLAKVLGNMSWDYEEDLSHAIGDAPANQLAELGRKAAAEAKNQTTNIAAMLAEYWQEEQPLIAKKRHVEQFIKDVDALREDVERFTKRLEKFTNQSKTPPTNKF